MLTNLPLSNAEGIDIMPPLAITNVHQITKVPPMQWEARAVSDDRPVYIRYEEYLLSVKVGLPNGSTIEAAASKDFFFERDCNLKDGSFIDWKHACLLANLECNNELFENVTYKLYHYCSTDAFYNIISGKTLRIGYAKFMNDPHEMIFAEAEINECLKAEEAIYDRGTDDQRFFAPAFYPYIVCFSSRSDIANQWNRYADEGRGFVIEFEPNAFRIPAFEIYASNGQAARLQASAFGMALVKYDKDSQKALIREIVQHCINNSRDKTISAQDAMLFALLQRAAYQIKDPDFSEEEEIRIILVPSKVTDTKSELSDLASRLFDGVTDDANVDHRLVNDNLHFRATRDTITTFYELNLAPDYINSISSVIMGPENKTETGVVELFLRRSGFKDVRVTRINHT
jgi:hypothetical protein